MFFFAACRKLKSGVSSNSIIFILYHVPWNLSVHWNAVKNTLCAWVHVWTHTHCQLASIISEPPYVTIHDLYYLPSNNVHMLYSLQMVVMCDMTTIIRNYFVTRDREYILFMYIYSYQTCKDVLIHITWTLLKNLSYLNVFSILHTHSLFWVTIQKHLINHISRQ